MTTSQAGAILGRSARTVQRMAERGDLPYVQRLSGPNGSYLFDPDTVHRMARELELKAQPKKKAS